MGAPLDRQEFLRAALPDTGYICVAAIENRRVRHYFVNSVDEADSKINEVSSRNCDVYVAYATFSAHERKQEVAQLVRAFWLDIDCGEAKAEAGKGYASQRMGLAALDEFCEELGLPAPTVNNSGRGLHVFWMLDEPIEADVWRVTADKLKRLCDHHKLLADPAVTADSARILRVPGTYNFKDRDDPKQVVVLRQGEVSDYRSFDQALTRAIEAAGLTVPTLATMKAAKRQLDATTQALLNNRTHSFREILRRSIKGTGCAQIKYAAEHQEDVDEPMWRAVLSIAQHCEDREWGIHIISSKHPEYSPLATENKARQTSGPYRCETFRSMEPSRCEGCPHAISSPIMLHSKIAEYSPESDGAERYLNGKAAAAVAAINGAAARDVEVEETGEGVVEAAAPGLDPEDPIHLVAKYDPPHPFFRGKFGGVYMHTTGGDGEAAEVMIYQNDLFPTRIVHDPIDGFVVEMHHYSQQQGLHTFTVPFADAISPEKCKTVLSKHGVIESQNRMKLIMDYQIAFVKQIYQSKQADKARTQFGWADRDTKFIIGSREVGPRKIGYSPASTATSEAISAYHAEGELREWKKAFNMMVGDEFGAHGFALMTAFGAPLLKFTGVKGAMISLVNDKSGTGKTTILKLINSVWGHPTEALLHQKDTMMSKIHRIGVLNNLPATLDELTNMPAAELSDIIYSVTDGKGKNRMEASANKERTNTTRWATLAVCTGNAFISDKLAAYKAASEGEQMRLIEILIGLAHNPNADSLMELVHRNYGMAGEVYIQYVVANLSSVIDLIHKTADVFAKAVDAPSKERFWVNTVAVNIAGGVIAQKLGLHDYNMKAIFRWAVEHFKGARQDVAEAVVSSQDMLGEFINANYSSYLIIDKTKVNPITGNNVVKNVSNKVVARFERDTSTLYVTKSEFRKFCVERQIGVKAALNSLSGSCKFKGDQKKRMATGTGVSSPPVEAYVFYAPNMDDLEDGV